MSAPLIHADPAFEFVGGDPALDLVNTVDWTDHGLVNERLPDYGALLAWAGAAGVLAATTAERLRRAAAAHPREARRAHTGALEARALLRAALGGEARGQAQALSALNPLLGEALGHLELAPRARGTRRAAWTWRDMDRRLDAALWPVLRSAADLLASEEADRIRTCGGPDCGWMYVDRSRNGLRRWCQMRTCGTREKSRRRRVAGAE
ncbi:MAG TPA: CGNR zinc finger domain-containing protein [Gemmatimonadales bacterium]